MGETLPGGHHEASPPCLCRLLRCGIGDLYGNPGHHRLRRHHLLLPLHYRLRRHTQGCLQKAEQREMRPGLWSDGHAFHAHCCWPEVNKSREKQKDCKIGSLAASLASINICRELV